MQCASFLCAPFTHKDSQWIAYQVEAPTFGMTVTPTIHWLLLEAEAVHLVRVMPHSMGVYHCFRLSRPACCGRVYNAAQGTSIGDSNSRMCRPMLRCCALRVDTLTTSYCVLCCVLPSTQQTCTCANEMAGWTTTRVAAPRAVAASCSMKGMAIPPTTGKRGRQGMW